MLLWLLPLSLPVPYPSACQQIHVHMFIRVSQSMICIYDSGVKVSYTPQLKGELSSKKYQFWHNGALTRAEQTTTAPFMSMGMSQDFIN